jgi:hypothetical protein
MIAARHRQSGHSHWWKKPGAAKICEIARLREILEQSLKSINPTSVHQIAASLGYSNAGFILRKFPELCAAIRETIAHTENARPEQMRRTLEKALGDHSVVHEQVLPGSAAHDRKTASPLLRRNIVTSYCFAISAP